MHVYLIRLEGSGKRKVESRRWKGQIVDRQSFIACYLSSALLRRGSEYTKEDVIEDFEAFEKEAQSADNGVMPSV